MSTAETDNDKHEQDAQEFVRAVDTILIEGLRLSKEEHPDIFRKRSELLHDLRGLLSDAHWRGRKAEQKRLRQQLDEML
jgi:hypothetical protein